MGRLDETNLTRRRHPQTGQRSGVYYVVTEVPRHLRAVHAFGGKTRFMQSTKTADLAEAVRRRPAILAGFQQQIADERARLGFMSAEFWAGARRAVEAVTEPMERAGLEAAIDDDALAAGDLPDWHHEPNGHHVDADGRRAALAYAATTTAGHGWSEATREGLPAAAPPLGAASTPLDEHLDAWLASCRSPSTQTNYRRTWVAIAADLHEAGLITVEAVTKREAAKMVAKWQAAVTAGTKSANYAKSFITAAASYWNHLAANGVLPEAGNPWSGRTITAPLNPDGSEPDTTDKRAFTDDELRVLLRYVDGSGDRAQHYGDMLRVYALSGMRCEELARLKVGQVEITAGQVRVGWFRRVLRKGRKIMDLPVHDDLLPILTRLTAGRAAGAPLFARPDTGGFHRPHAISSKYSILIRKAGLVEFGTLGEISLHSTRHWAATSMLNAGIPERVVEGITGHNVGGKRKGTLRKVYDHGAAPETLTAAVNTLRLPT